MPPSKRLWDSAACLAWLNGEPTAPNCRATLDAVQAGKVELYISVLAITETLMIKGKPKLPVATKLKVRAFFKNPWLIPVEIDRYCAEVAQDLVWDHGIAPKDAIHVAAALIAECDILETFDHGLLKKSGKVGGTPLLEIREPGSGFTLPLMLDEGTSMPQATAEEKAEILSSVGLQ